ncbi:MAG TPA: universal stress protein [Clostridiaceae bacterium]|nr:universal stress protein [Clostridiaceae bacterium]
MKLLKNILVCVTQQKTCERLILKASELKRDSEGELFVIHVVRDGLNFLNNPKEGEALQYLFEISKSVGANLSVLKSDNVVRCIADFAKDNDIDCIILGSSPTGQGKDSFYSKLRNVLPGVEIVVVP